MTTFASKILIPLAALVSLVAVVPAALLFARSWLEAGGVAGFVSVWSATLSGQALGNSVLQGALSAALAVLLGYPAGVFFGRFRFRGRDTLLSIVLVPFLLPSLVVILGLQELFGPAGVLSTALPSLEILSRGLPGVLAVNVSFNLSIVILFTSAALENYPRELEETIATLGGGPGRAFLGSWGRPSALGASAGALLTFVFSALGFAAPLVVCGPRCFTLEARVWELARLFAEPNSAALLAAGMVAILSVPTAAYLLVLARLRAERSPRPGVLRPVPWRSPAVWPLAAVTSVTVAALLALLGVIVLRAFIGSAGTGASGVAVLRLFGPTVTARIGITTLHAAGNSLFFAATATGVALLFGVVGGYAIRSARAGRRVFQYLLFFPLLLSPIVLAFALAVFWQPLLGGSSAIWVLIFLSQTVLALPFALQSVYLALDRVPASARESAQLLGVPPWSAYLDAEVPRVRDALVTAALFAFALSLGEFTATFFLFTPAYTTLPVELYLLESTRQFAEASALAGVLVLVSLAAFLGIGWGGRKIEL